jgi:hypothetical protein
MKFDVPVTGYLLDARPREGGYRAAIFFDSLGRYENGDTFTTSKLSSVSESQGYTLITTANGSQYVVVSQLLFTEEKVEGTTQTVIYRFGHDPVERIFAEVIPQAAKSE